MTLQRHIQHIDVVNWFVTIKMVLSACAPWIHVTVNIHITVIFLLNQYWNLVSTNLVTYMECYVCLCVVKVGIYLFKSNCSPIWSYIILFKYDNYQWVNINNRYVINQFKTYLNRILQCFICKCFSDDFIWREVDQNIRCVNRYIFTSATCHVNQLHNQKVFINCDVSELFVHIALALNHILRKRSRKSNLNTTECIKLGQL